MEYIKAKEEHIQAVAQLVQSTIRAVYPKYYPKKVVDFFCSLHSGDAIGAAARKGSVWVLFLDSRLAATGSLEENHITRVYVAPDFQGRGLGSFVMQQLEGEAGAKYAEVFLDASLPASRFYEKQGYKTVRHEELLVENGAVLVYEVMRKKLPCAVEQ